MYKIALCDDDEECLKLIRETLLNYCACHNFEVRLQVFGDSDALLELIEEKKFFDAYILDIDLPVHSGLELVKQIRAVTELPVIILLTGYEQYAVEACGMDIFRYVLKSEWDKKAERTLRELFDRLKNISDDRVYVISNQRKHVMFRVRDIIYIYKSQKKAVFVLLGREDETERQTLLKVYEKLKDPEMFFLDRCYIINILHIQRIEKNMIKMEGGYEIMSSEENIGKLKSYLSSYWGKFL